MAVVWSISCGGSIPTRVSVGQLAMLVRERLECVLVEVREEHTICDASFGVCSFVGGCPNRLVAVRLECIQRRHSRSVADSLSSGLLL